MSYKVSVVVAIYNVAEFLPKCIESILQQTYSNIEVLLIDDGSTDGSREIVDAFAKNDSRIRPMHQENSGPSACRNTGMDAAIGEFIAFVDGDDWLAADFVAYLLRVQAKTKSDMVISRNCFTSNDELQIKKDTITTLSSGDAIELLFYPNVKLGVWNKLFKLEFLKMNNVHFIPRFRAGEGLQFIINAASIANSIGMGERKVYYYRLDNARSATTKPAIEKQGIGSLQAMEYIKQNLSVHTKTIERAMQWRYWSSYGYCLRQIVASSAYTSYHDLYRECIRRRRDGALEQLKANLPLIDKLIAVVVAISPVAVAKLSLLKNHIKNV